MAELAVLVATVIAAVVVALVDRATDPRIRVVGGGGYRDRVRRAIDRVRVRRSGDSARGRTADSDGSDGTGSVGGV